MRIFCEQRFIIVLHKIYIVDSYWVYLLRQILWLLALLYKVAEQTNS